MWQRVGGAGGVEMVLNGGTVEHEVKFRYLGVCIGATEPMETEVRHRVRDQAKVLGV